MLEIIKEVLGWTSVAFYISITIFNSMRFTRYASFGSAGNDIVWSILMGWWPKLILNLSVGVINTYRYCKDFTSTSKRVLDFTAALMGCGILYIIYFAVSNFIANPTLSVGLQFMDLGLIVAALSMKQLDRYRLLMLISGFVGMFAYYGNAQMMIIKAIVIGIMSYKLVSPSQREVEPAK
ncbi:hypothetical protein [Thaumasiovibrio subtropicus]|uniref:hypothetical protein n=1 Tax=Thaumasiovibrio subtropicus TaxID=1891207 RepID=UPI000B35EA63|nr:hypothetical protein [Thaumasiovibrio subtropicus]